MNQPSYLLSGSGLTQQAAKAEFDKYLSKYDLLSEVSSSLADLFSDDGNKDTDKIKTN